MHLRVNRRLCLNDMPLKTERRHLKSRPLISHISASRHMDVPRRSSIREVFSAAPPQHELLDISPAKHYDSFCYVLRCCVSPPGRFPVI